VQLGAVTARHVRDHAARQRRREGRREVIKGCEEGVNGMKVGGRRVITVPPQLAYGAAGLGELIPPNATPIFDIELIEVK